MHKLLHLLDPETAHNIAIKALSKGLSPKFKTPQKPVEVFGLKFPNPVGMAAGFDKNAEAIDGLLNLGFGFVEVGSVTPRPQDGNPKPRIFRLKEDQAIINRLGFNNKGIDIFLENVAKAKRNGIVGINIGANKDTENFIDDYAKLLPLVNDHADYITANISSPNTPGLRGLQEKEQIRNLVGKLASLKKDKPLLVKIAPDLNDEELYAMIDTFVSEGIDGVIATNTTIARPRLNSYDKDQQGGLSGQPLRSRSTEIVRKISSHAGKKLPIIAVGGIKDAESAKEKLNSGASLVQVYTGLIYEGPKIVKNIVEGL